MPVLNIPNKPVVFSKQAKQANGCFAFPKQAKQAVYVYVNVNANANAYVNDNANDYVNEDEDVNVFFVVLFVVFQ